MKTANEAMEQFRRNGWSVVPYREQPAPVREAIKLARFRPLMKQCFSNSQKLVLFQSKYPFRYHEGIVKSVIPVMHAWTSLDGVRVDVTLPDMPEIISGYEVDREEVRARIQSTGYYGPIRPQELQKLHSNAMGVTDMPTWLSL